MIQRFCRSSSCSSCRSCFFLAATPPGMAFRYRTECATCVAFAQPGESRRWRFRRIETIATTGEKHVFLWDDTGKSAVPSTCQMIGGY